MTTRSLKSLAGALASTARRDTLVHLALTLYLGAGLCLPVLESALVPSETSQPHSPLGLLSKLGHLSMLALVLLSLTHGLGRVASFRERVFWKRLALAYGCWFVGALILLLPDPLGPVPRRPLQVIFYGFFYLFMLRALEGQPHRPSTLLRTGMERLLTWPSLTFFVLGLMIYFVLIPVTSQWGSATAPNDRVEEFYLYTLLDIYLSGRLLVLARRAGTRRWRTLYHALALPWIFLVVFVDLTVVAPVFRPLGQIPEWWWNLPFVLQVMAARLRHHPSSREPEPGEAESPVAQRDEELSFTASAQTLALGVIFPVIHIVVSRFDLVDGANLHSRQAFMLVWLVFFGLVAFVQHRQLERRAQELWMERVSFEEALRTSEKDLRLIIERHRASEMLRASVEKFDLAFKACPYTLAITSLEDGRFLEVNPAFEETFGYSREEVVGRSVQELDLWLAPDDVGRVRRLVEEREEVREIEIGFRDRSGEHGVALLSAAEIDLEGEPCLISIVHDVTGKHRMQEGLEATAALVERTGAAIFRIDGDGRIRSWNRGARRLFGWTEEEAVGRPARDLVRQPTEAASQLGDVGTETSEGSGELELTTRGGDGVAVLAWYTRVKGSDGSRLVICVPS